MLKGKGLLSVPWVMLSVLLLGVLRAMLVWARGCFILMRTQSELPDTKDHYSPLVSC